MVKTADVITGQEILAQWGNTIRDRSVQVFASVGARDSQYPPPHDGALCYTQAENTYWQGKGGAWVQMTVQAVGTGATGPTGPPGPAGGPTGPTGPIGPTGVGV